MNVTPTVKQLLIINIIFFLGSMLVPQTQVYLALYSPQSEHFRIWQPVTHMFMHGNFMHIFFNMFALYSFGSTLEHFWGTHKFLFFYFSCGIGAALMQMGVNYYELQHILEGAADLNLSSETLNQILNATVSDQMNYRPDLFESEVRPILEHAGKLNILTTDSFNALFNAARSCQVPMVGASGAIYGLLVAFAFMFPHAELAIMFIPIPVKAKYFVPGLIAVDFFLGVSSGGEGGVAHFAHIGGAIVGFLMMWYWKKNQFDKHRWDR